MGGRKNEDKKILTDLLKNLKIPKFKYRLIRGEVDLFIPSKDFFIYFNKEESSIFKWLFVENKKIGDLIHHIKENTNSNETNTIKKIKNFILDLSESLK